MAEMPRSQKLDINPSFLSILFVLFLAVLGLGCGTQDLPCIMLDLSLWLMSFALAVMWVLQSMWASYLWPSDFVGPWHVESYFLK